MFEAFYGLSGPPFQLSPDPSFYFGSRGHVVAHQYLRFGVHQGEGFIVITGDIGAGKTTLIRTLLEELDPSEVVAAQLVSTQLEASDLLRAVSAAFGIPTGGKGKADLLASLEGYLASLAIEKRRALLVIDEAQNLSDSAIEELRMLSNFQFGNRTLLQSFLVGQPELRNILRSPSMEQLRQRVIASCHLGPMGREETRSYMEHRLTRVAWNRDPEIEAEAFDEIYKWTDGVPRRINLLANRVLLASFLEDKHSVNRELVERIAHEIRSEIGGPHASARPSDGLSAAPIPPPSAEVSVAPAVRQADPDERDVASGVSVSISTSAPRPQRKLVIKSGEAGPIFCVVNDRESMSKMMPLLVALKLRAQLPTAVLVQSGKSPATSRARLQEDISYPSPHFVLGADAGSEAVQMAQVLTRLDALAEKYEPSAVLVCGEACTTLAAALVASKRRVPLFDLDAGLRSRDALAGQIANRQIVEGLSDLFFVSEPNAASVIARTGVLPDRIRLVGNLTADFIAASVGRAIDPMDTMLASGDRESYLSHLSGFGLMSLNDPAVLDDRERLGELIDTLHRVSEVAPLLWPMEAQLRSRIKRFGLLDELESERIALLPPLGFLRTIGMMLSAAFVLTDGPTLQNESCALGIPCLTLTEHALRDIMVEQGSLVALGDDREALLAAVSEIMAKGGKRGLVPEPWDGKAANRIAEQIAQALAPGETADTVNALAEAS